MYSFNHGFNRDTLRRIRRNDPTLKVLRISDVATPNPNHGDVGAYVPGYAAELGELAGVGKNTYLESLCLDGDQRGLDDASTASFFAGVRRNASIRNLSLCRCDLSREGGASRQILDAFGSHRGGDLIGISLHRCNLGDGGIHHALASTLSRCENIERFRLTESRGNLRLPDGMHFLLNHVLDDSLPQLVSAIGGHRSLRELDLGRNDIVGRAGCEALARLLKDPGCKMVTLRLENNLLDGECATALADALVENRTLENLYLHGNPVYGSGLLDGIFSKVLCDTSSINATYRSNHTLQSFEKFRDWPLLPCLELNRANNDKKLVAMRKILRHHILIDMEPFFEWDMKVLPIAAAWFETGRTSGEDATIVDSRKLSAIYQFVHAMPMTFVSVSLGARDTGMQKKLKRQ